MTVICLAFGLILHITEKHYVSWASSLKFPDSYIYESVHILTFYFW